MRCGRPPRRSAIKAASYSLRAESKTLPTKKRPGSTRQLTHAIAPASGTQHASLTRNLLIEGPEAAACRSDAERPRPEPTRFSEAPAIGTAHSKLEVNERRAAELAASK